jgi:hypothetical protein
LLMANDKYSVEVSNANKFIVVILNHLLVLAVNTQDSVAILPRMRLISPRWVLVSSRRRCAPYVGLVA